MVTLVLLHFYYNYCATLYSNGFFIFPVSLLLGPKILNQSTDIFELAISFFFDSFLVYFLSWIGDSILEVPLIR